MSKEQQGSQTEYGKTTAAVDTTLGALKQTTTGLLGRTKSNLCGLTSWCWQTCRMYVTRFPPLAGFLLILGSLASLPLMAFLAFVGATFAGLSSIAIAIVGTIEGALVAVSGTLLMVILAVCVGVSGVSVAGMTLVWIGMSGSRWALDKLYSVVGSSSLVSTGIGKGFQAASAVMGEKLQPQEAGYYRRGPSSGVYASETGGRGWYVPGEGQFTSEAASATTQEQQRQVSGASTGGYVHVSPVRAAAAATSALISEPLAETVAHQAEEYRQEGQELRQQAASSIAEPKTETYYER